MNSRGSLFVFLILCAFFNSCVKSDDPPVEQKLPSVLTLPVTEITPTSAICNGEVTDSGNLDVTEKGICWGNNPNPDITGVHAACGSGLGSFNVKIQGLMSEGTYYVRAYATNSLGTSYGNDLLITQPSVITSSVTVITNSLAICDCEVKDDYGADVTERGVCWGPSQYPDLNGPHASNGVGLGTYSVSIPGLIEGNTYYVRAYAINCKGVGFGEVKAFFPHQPGVLKGKFSISDDEQVYFSSGNLQYQASTNTWRFAEHQYDCVGDDNMYISSSYDGWIDLFGWGTSGWPSGASCYQPWNTSTNYYGYCPGGSYTNDLTGEYANADWGIYNAISNGGDQPGMWRTLTKDEWVYLINMRNTSSGFRFAKASVNNINGLILLPNEWNSNFCILNNMDDPAGDYYNNKIPLSLWENYLESNGAVFLPVSYYRVGDMLRGGDCGQYWSSSYSDEDCAYCMMFSSHGIASDVGSYRRLAGFSVRLVRPVEWLTPNEIP